MRKIDFINNPLYPTTDIGIAKLFLDSFKEDLFFCNDNAEWYVWNGMYWERDSKEGGKRNEMLKELVIYCNDCVQRAEMPKEIKEPLLSYYRRLNARYYRESIIKDAQSINPRSSKLFNQNKFLFNCQNGTFDLQRNIFRDFEREDFLTEVSNVTYDKHATCPRFKQFLNEILVDQDKIDYLLKMASYCLTGDTKYECFFVLYGNKTRNGKSTFVSTLQYLLGSYAKVLMEKTITKKQFNSGSGDATPEIARLRDSRLALVNEIAQDMMLDVALIKTMTGGDTLLARQLYKENFEFKPKFKLVINTNDLPKMSEDSIFRSGRLHVLSFNVSFLGREDPNLKETLLTEVNGIFNLIVPYLSKLYTEGWKPPQETLDLIEQYQNTSNNILLYQKECIYKEPSAYEKVSEVYADYVKWCEECGYYPLSKKNFKERMSQIGYSFTEKVNKKNKLGFYENTYWLVGMTLTKPKDKQITLEPISDDISPFK